MVSEVRANWHLYQSKIIDLKVGRLRPGNKFGVKRFETGTRAVTKRCTPFRQWKPHADLVSEAVQHVPALFNMRSTRRAGSAQKKLELNHFVLVNLKTHRTSETDSHCTV